MSKRGDQGAGRVALVTGGNRGLGLETCRQLLGRGLRVVMTGRDERATMQAAATLDDPAGHLMVVRMDVTDAGSIAAARRAVDERFGAVEILVNNAAVLLSASSHVLAITADAYRQTFDTNLFGAIETCRVFAPAMIERRYGRIVNVSSGLGQISNASAYGPAYALSKVALNAFTRMLADTSRGRGVLVNAVDPGWVRTDMGGSSATRSVQEGARTIVWLATLPDNGPSGGFFRDERPIEW